MIIKRAFYAMLVLMLMPLIAQAQITIPTPAHGTAVIAVAKFFDNFDEQSVNVRIQCDGGSIAPSDKIEVEPTADQYSTSFVVYNLGPGQTTECRVWEEPVDGYTAAYECGADFPGSGPDDSCLFAEDGPSAVECTFHTISANTNNDFTASPGSQAACGIFNEVNTVEVETTKVWEVFGQAGDDFSDAASIQFTCDAPIVGGTTSGDGYYRLSKYIGSGSYVDGMATVSADVYPLWYANGDTTTCWVNEFNTASGVEVDESDCQNLSVAIGSAGVACTITNTMFFEGIPTLNQYGMALMALLMLGVGFVGFRRFV